MTTLDPLQYTSSVVIDCVYVKQTENYTFPMRSSAVHINACILFTTHAVNQLIEKRKDRMMIHCMATSGAL